MQDELVEVDEFYDADNISSVVQESDFAPFKPKCDVLLVNASAHAPPNGGGSASRCRGFRQGCASTAPMAGRSQKLVTVTGPRTLGRGLMGGYSLSEPEPVLAVPIRYEHAYGGTNQWWKGWPARIEDDQRMEIDLHEAYNPIGCGLIEPNWQKKTGLSQFPAPQIEIFEKPFTSAHAETAARNAGNPDADAPYPAVGFRCHRPLVAAAPRAGGQLRRGVRRRAGRACPTTSTLRTGTVRPMTSRSTIPRAASW